MATKKNKGHSFSKKRTNTEKLMFTSGIPGLEDLHFGCGRQYSDAQFKESLLEFSNHVIWNIEYVGGKSATRIRSTQIVVIVVLDKVADNVAAMAPVRQKMWLGDWAEDSKYNWSLQQDIPKGYTTVFKMCTPRLLTKLEGVNGYTHVRSNQYIVGMLLLICSICCEYNIYPQETYETMQVNKCVGGATLVAKGSQQRRLQ